METLTDFARGPLFRFAAAVAVLGLLRYAVLGAWGLRQARRRAGDKRLALGQVIARTLAVLNPVRYFTGNRGLYSITSTAFHLGVILVPIFFAGHVRLWRRGVGFGWPALPASVADALTLLTIATGLLLLAGRASLRASRQLSRPQDWVLPKQYPVWKTWVRGEHALEFETTTTDTTSSTETGKTGRTTPEPKPTTPRPATTQTQTVAPPPPPTEQPPPTTVPPPPTFTTPPPTETLPPPTETLPPPTETAPPPEVTPTGPT